VADSHLVEVDTGLAVLGMGWEVVEAGIDRVAEAGIGPVDLPPS
jgi:hypothetical protein